MSFATIVQNTAPSISPADVSTGTSTATMSSPRQMLARQLSLLSERNTEALRETFVPHLRDKITPELLANADLDGFDADDIHCVWTRESGGVTRAIVPMVTSLVFLNGQWLCESIWF